MAWRAGAPLSIEAVDLDGPRDGEVLFNARNEWIGGREGFEGMKRGESIRSVVAF